MRGKSGSPPAGRAGRIWGTLAVLVVAFGVSGVVLGWMAEQYL